MSFAPPSRLLKNPCKNFMEEENMICDRYNQLIFGHLLLRDLLYDVTSVDDFSIRLSDRVSALIRRIIPIKSKIRLHILKHAVFHQKSFNFLLFINISYDTEQYLAFTAYKI